MDVLHDPLEMQKLALAWRAGGSGAVLVPTMGALHEGHATLLREAKKHGGPLVLSVFVNPTQFGPKEDFSAYPRTLETDCEIARREGVEAVFSPSPEAMYPAGFQTHVEVESLTLPLCGPFRPGHFRGVATVVMKLFQIIQPTKALFGWKDAQQFLVLRRMVEDLNVPTEMIGVETVREKDGLAMSSRNKYLTPEQRAAAPALYRGLSALRSAALAGEPSSEKLLSIARAEIAREPIISLEYLEMLSMDRLQPLAAFAPGNTLVALAARLGQARLIDNIRI